MRDHQPSFRLHHLLAVLLILLAVPVALPATSARAASGPVVVPLPASAKPGATTTVGGSGWPASTLLTVLICGQNAVAGTDDCANDAGRAVTTDANGRFTQQLTVETPPQPCPCVVHVTTVLGSTESADAPFDVIGAPVKPIPPNAAGSGQLHALSASLTGGGNPLNWFGAPPSRTLRVIVTNLGAAPVSDPEFQMGIWHSVLAPEWSAAPWQGVVQPGQKVEIDLPVEFGSGASGRWSVALRYQGQDFASAYEDLPVAWGVYLFWTLLGVVAAVGLYRIGMAVLDRVRPDAVERHRDARRATLG
uniref:neocarzinostatin apoprotein domain-containing protein n=1 Tax=Streptacidiphilus neutrinimicus TaxID=105420 RepID=UPI000693256F